MAAKLKLKPTDRKPIHAYRVRNGDIEERLFTKRAWSRMPAGVDKDGKRVPKQGYKQAAPQVETPPEAKTAPVKTETKPAAKPVGTKQAAPQVETPPEAKTAPVKTETKPAAKPVGTKQAAPQVEKGK